MTAAGRLVQKGGKELDSEVNRHSSAIIMGRPDAWISCLYCLSFSFLGKRKVPIRVGLPRSDFENPVCEVFQYLL